MSLEVISAFIGLILTLLIFSYLIGDNPLFRMAVYLFVGVSSGYAAAVIWHQVLMPKLFARIQLNDPNELILTLIPLVLSLSLLTKFTPRISWIGSIAMAIVVGVGAAAAIGGALLGTLLPQTQAATQMFDLSVATSGAQTVGRFFGGILALAGTIFTLASFHFSATRAADGTVKTNRILDMIGLVGRIFVSITLGVLFAGVYVAALTAMIERLSTNLNFIRGLIGI